MDMQIAQVGMEQSVYMDLRMNNELSIYTLHSVKTIYFECLGQWGCLFERFVEPALYHCEQDSTETGRGRQLMLRWAKGEKLLDTHRPFS